MRTFLLALQAILVCRHSRYGLLLSELGGYLLSPDHAPAGTQRLSNLLRSRKWSFHLIQSYLWQQAEQARQTLQAAGETVYAI